eukprot:m.134628 g.134628  ORF g.134628 m.134628 type:complete len:82 (+) comp9657_c0_seq1:70-315(+)
MSMRSAASLTRRLVQNQAARRTLRAELDFQAPGTSLPFKNGPNNKGRLGLTLGLYLGVGFVAPFLVAKYALNSNGIHTGVF